MSCLSLSICPDGRHPLSPSPFALVPSLSLSLIYMHVCIHILSSLSRGGVRVGVGVEVSVGVRVIEGESEG